MSPTTSETRDDIDTIDTACDALLSILRGQVVSCRALAQSTETDDAIGYTDLQTALAGLAEVLASLEAMVVVINTRVDNLRDGGAR